MNILSIQNLYIRNTGMSIQTNTILKKGFGQELEAVLEEEDLLLALQSNLAIIEALKTQIAQIEQAGAENAMGGLAQAYADNIPILVLPGGIPISQMGGPSKFFGCPQIPGMG